MQICNCDISTICFGLAASMGAFLLSSGTKGKRYAMPNARIMIHQPLGGGRGSAIDFAIQAQEIIYHRDNLNRVLSLNTGKPASQVGYSVFGPCDCCSSLTALCNIECSNEWNASTCRHLCSLYDSDRQILNHQITAAGAICLIVLPEYRITSWRFTEWFSFATGRIHIWGVLWGFILSGLNIPSFGFVT